jgi:hypothetical protein
MSLKTSKWNSNGLRVGWHIQNAKGLIGVVTWVSPTDKTYTYKLLNPQPKTESESSDETTTAN